MSDLEYVHHSAERAMHEYTLEHARDRLFWWRIHLAMVRDLLRATRG